MKKNKVILVLPNFRWRSSVEHILWDYIPYGLCILASLIEKRYDVKIIDAYKENLSVKEFSHRIMNEKPSIVGITALMDYFGPTLHKAAKIVKDVDPSISVIVGGVYPTTNIEKVMNDKNIDYLIAGEGEIAFPLLVDKIHLGGDIEEDEHFKSGIYYKKDGKVIGEGRSKKIEDLDKVPFPAYHLIPYMEYASVDEDNRINLPSKMPYAPLYTSRGCPYHCCFCQIEHILGRGFRARSSNNVLSEVDWLIEKYGIRSVVIMDDNFLVDRTRAIEIIKGLAIRDIEWMMIDTAAYLLDDELLEIMAGCGCKNLAYAIETGTLRVMHEIIHKPIRSLDQVHHLVKKAQSLGIYVEANFIIGFPGETWHEIRETISYAEKIDADYVRFFAAYPLPHTEIYREAIKQDCLVEGFDPGNIDWKQGCMETDEFTRLDLLILRTYEWDRINFGSKRKREKNMKRMRIDEKELDVIRKKTFEETRCIIGEILKSDVPTYL